jgi:hypothetical protein
VRLQLSPSSKHLGKGGGLKGTAARAVTPFARFIRIADRLGEVAADNIEADQTIHAALGLTGPVLPYSREKAATRSLLPKGFEWLEPHYSGPAVYASCRRSGMDGEWLYLHHGQWGPTLPLAMCGVVMRGWWVFFGTLIGGILSAAAAHFLDLHLGTTAGHDVVPQSARHHVG